MTGSKMQTETQEGSPKALRLHQPPGKTELFWPSGLTRNHAGAPESPATSSTGLGSFLVLWSPCVKDECLNQ